MKVIQIQADGPARLAQLIVARLQREGLLEARLCPPAGPRKPSDHYRLEAITEAVADVIHLDAVEATLRGKP